MIRALNNPLRWLLAAGASALLLMAIAAGPARADTFPAGSGTFSGSSEGWVTTQSECKLLGLVELGLLCDSKESGYSGTVGNPPGSLDAHTKVIVNLLSAFESHVSFRSPEFTAPASGPATLHLERQFALGTLIDLIPAGGYKVVLIDATSGNVSVLLEESLGAASDAFVGKDAAATVVGGHTYALEIQTSIKSTVALGLLEHSGDLRFDNVSLTAPGGGGGGAGGGGAGGGNTGGNGSNSTLTDSRLASLLRSSLAGSATVKGNRVFVKVKCPAKIGAACRVTVQGLLKKGKPATATRKAKIAKGKSKQLVLKVKPKLRKVVAKRKKLLIKQTVKAAGAKATVYKQMKLIRHR